MQADEPIAFRKVQHRPPHLTGNDKGDELATVPLDETRVGYNVEIGNKAFMLVVYCLGSEFERLSDLAVVRVVWRQKIVRRYRDLYNIQCMCQIDVG